MLSLIPAKYYYDDESSEQWSKKKNSKEQKRQAKKIKFNPNSKVDALSAQNKMAAVAKPVKLPGPDGEDTPDNDENSEEESEDDFIMPGDDEISEGSDNETSEADNTDVDLKKQNKPIEESLNQKDIEVDHGDDDEDESLTVVFDDEGNEISAGNPNLTEQPTQNKKSHKNIVTEEEKKEKKKQLDELKNKLSAKINLLREKRKAPGTSVKGAPMSREKILEQRRLKKEENLKKRKREEEVTDDEEEDDDEEEQDEEANGIGSTSNSLFNNVIFKDGDSSNNKRKSKDLASKLREVEARNAKLAQLDKDTQDKIQKKDSWTRAIKQSAGEKVYDDEKLLRKSLKRQQKKKNKSEREWNEREENVKKSIATRQKKREANIQLKKDMKQIKGKKARKRAGFEGKLKSGRKGKK